MLCVNRTQTLDEVTVYVNLPRRVSGKQMKVALLPRHVTVMIAEGEGAGTTYLSGELDEAIRVDESMWTLSSSSSSSSSGAAAAAPGEGRTGAPSQVILTLEKAQKTWWRRVVAGGAEIDTSKVDSTQKISDYDLQTQSAIRKIMFDQQQKVNYLILSKLTAL
jgi:hypothetical protein